MGGGYKVVNVITSRIEYEIQTNGLLINAPSVALAMGGVSMITTVATVELRWRGTMLIITISVDAPAGQAIGIKEHLAQELERFGDTRVLDIKETKVEQMRIKV